MRTLHLRTMFIVHICVHHSCVQGNVYLTSYLKVSQKMHILSSGILKKILNLIGERNTPLFPIYLWNNFHLVPQGLLRSTNLDEAWHRGFQSTCGCHHHTIWKSIDCLKISNFVSSSLYLLDFRISNNRLSLNIIQHSKNSPEIN